MNIYSWAEHLYDVFMFTVLIPLGWGGIRWRFLSVSERWIMAFLTALLAHELLSILCMKLHTRNHFLYYLQTVAVLFSVAGVYQPSMGRGRWLWQVAALVSGLVVVEVVGWVGFNHINSGTLTVSRLLAAVYAGISLNRLLAAKPTPERANDRLVYAHLGFFLWGAFTAINACFKSYFIENSLDLYYFFNVLSAMVSAVAFALFCVCFSRIPSVRTAF